MGISIVLVWTGPPVLLSVMLVLLSMAPVSFFCLFAVITNGYELFARLRKG